MPKPPLSPSVMFPKNLIGSVVLPPGLQSKDLIHRLKCNAWRLGLLAYEQLSYEDVENPFVVKAGGGNFWLIQTWDAAIDYCQHPEYFADL